MVDLVTPEQIRAFALEHGIGDSGATRIIGTYTEETYTTDIARTIPIFGLNAGAKFVTFKGVDLKTGEKVEAHFKGATMSGGVSAISAATARLLENIGIALDLEVPTAVFGFTGEPKAMGGYLFGASLHAGAGAGAMMDFAGNVLYMGSASLSMQIDVSVGYVTLVEVDGKPVFYTGTRHDPPLLRDFSGVDQWDIIMKHALAGGSTKPVTVTYGEVESGLFVQHVYTSHSRNGGTSVIHVRERLVNALGDDVGTKAQYDKYIQAKHWRFDLDQAEVKSYRAIESCFAAGTMITMADGSLKPIETVEAGDLVMSYTQDGSLVAGRVAATQSRIAPNILDVFGLQVTPGHVTLCGEGRFSGRHVPLLDILRSDGAFVHQDGHLIRAATGCPVGSDEDRFIEAVVTRLGPDGTETLQASGQIRLGTRYILDDGRDISVADLIRASGAEVLENGLIAQAADAQPVAFKWVFSENLPRPEDYILQRSRTTLQDILQNADWEDIAPQLDHH